MTKTRRAKRGELRLTEVHIAKAELDAVPEAERIHFLMLAQTANELAMLRILTIQALMRGLVEAVAQFWEDTGYIYNESLRSKDPYLVARLERERATRAWIPQAGADA